MTTAELAPGDAGTGASPENPGLKVVNRCVRLRLRSRMVLFLLRLVVRPLLTRAVKSDEHALARAQLRAADMNCPDSAGLSIGYRFVGSEPAPGHIVGELDASKGRPVVLWLHGGAFLFPASPGNHLVMVSRICRDLDADGFLPDYRLAPFNRFPAALNDCERAYRVLLALGYSPSRIVLGGDSAGGNLALGVLQRIRNASLPFPACAVLTSPVTDMGRVHSPPARFQVMKRDPLLPVGSLIAGIHRLYVGNWDTSDPELSPIYMDCRGLPPLLFQVSTGEVLMDDGLMLAQRAGEAGVQTICSVWPLLPHAFPLFEDWLPECGPGRLEISDFARQHL